MESIGPQKENVAEHGDSAQLPSGEEAKLPSPESTELPAELMFDPDMNPTYEMYLQKTTDIPEQLLEPKYLSNNLFENVVLASYARSGSAFIRKYLGEITGVITGVDNDKSNPTSSQDPNDLGLNGKEVVDDKVWIVKTHSPGQSSSHKFNVNKCVLLVRNPLDAIISLYNLMATRRHDTTITEEDFEKNRSCFQEFFSQAVYLWKNFQSFWLEEPKIPTYIVRFEDLLSDRKNTLLDLFRFLLNEKDLEGTLIEALIEHHTDPKEAKQVYKPRKGKANANKQYYTESQIKELKREAGQMLKRLGYVKEGTDPTNKTGYYSDDEDIEFSVENQWEKFERNGEEVEVNTRHNYKELNEIMLDKVCTDKYKDSVKELSGLSSVELNCPGDFITKKSERHPDGIQPMRIIRKLIGTVDIVLPDGTIQKAV